MKIVFLSVADITVLLALSVYQVFVSDTLPTSSESVPIIGQSVVTTLRQRDMKYYVHQYILLQNIPAPSPTKRTPLLMFKRNATILEEPWMNSERNYQISPENKRPSYWSSYSQITLSNMAFTVSVWIYPNPRVSESSGVCQEIRLLVYSP